MLNPIKTPKEMLMEQANVPHYAAGNLVKGLSKELYQQFGKRIEEAIRRYMRATGKAPTQEEVAQLEQHIVGLTQKAPSAPQTTARLQAETPAANKLVDVRGRPYSTAVHPKTGKIVTPEQAQGYTVRDQFGSEPANMRAREGFYDPPHVNVFGEDPFLSVVNTGRLPSRTWMKSYTPSTEELAQRELQAAETGVEDTVGGLSRVQSYGEDVPTVRPSQLAEMASSLEAPAQEKLGTDIFLGKHKDLVEQAIRDFRARGIEPDEEDIFNAVNAMINPLRHNYTGINPIGLRPMPPRGRPSLAAEAEMNQWRDLSRASGVPESVVTKHPSDWPEMHKQDYLLDVGPGKRAPFAKDWALGEYANGGRIMPSRTSGAMVPQNKANPGYDWGASEADNSADIFHKSPRDMQAEMVVKGYAAGGKPAPVDYGYGRAFTQGLTMGWGDEAEAAVKALMDQGMDAFTARQTLSGLVTGDRPQSAYDRHLAAIQKGKEAFEKQHPVGASLAGLAGSIPTFIIPGMAATTIPRMAAIGAISGAGMANPGERLAGAAWGVPEGVAFGKGLEYATKGTQALGRGAKAAYDTAANRIRRVGINPEARLAEEITGRPFDFRAGMKAESTPARQEWIGKAHAAGAKAYRENDPAYKAAVYAQYLQQRPELIRQTGAQNYDQLMAAIYKQSSKETAEQFKRLPNKVNLYGDTQGAEKDYLARAARAGQKPAQFMREELRAGKPFDIYSGGNPHPMLSDVDPATGLNANEQFRAVHDYFGHLGPKTPNTFGPRGEENAWLAHKQMYSPLAEPALTAETRGQNSYVNYVNPRNLELRRQGLPTTEYAENVPVLLPPEASDAAYMGGMPEYLKRIVK